MKKYLIPQTQVCVCVPRLATLADLSLRNGESATEGVQYSPTRVM